MHGCLRAALVAVLLLLAGCGDPGLERVDVTWETDPPPRWGLYPGYRQEIPFPRGATYRVEVYYKGRPITGGVVSDPGGGLSFAPAGGARNIEGLREDRDHMTVSVTLRNEKGEARTLTALRVERREDKIHFEFPK